MLIGNEMRLNKQIIGRPAFWKTIGSRPGPWAADYVEYSTAVQSQKAITVYFQVSSYCLSVWYIFRTMRELHTGILNVAIQIYLPDQRRALKYFTLFAIILKQKQY